MPAPADTSTILIAEDQEHVREALAMLWDFEWSNRQMMRNMYIRQQSFFSNTALAARQLPDQAEQRDMVGELGGDGMCQQTRAT